LPDHLRALRAAAGLSYQQLAERAAIDQAYLYRLETGRKSNPSRDALIQIGIGLGLDVEALNTLIIAAGHIPLLKS
jgi:transcriptional regulator with XRE-family HTH domain